jgi:hypothetical protein
VRESMIRHIDLDNYVQTKRAPPSYRDGVRTVCNNNERSAVLVQCDKCKAVDNASHAPSGECVEGSATTPNHEWYVIEKKSLIEGEN